mmetsp:Transcript_92116/g.265803  ORF Transcript_92116/g.265803 Transcript_92116/m.265803 type:complete len:210 (-) Transcript_92116:598-1227(-)
MAHEASDALHVGPRRATVHQLVHAHPKRVDVGLFVVGLPLEDLGRAVQWRADHRLGHGLCGGDRPRDAQVTHEAEHLAVHARRRKALVRAAAVVGAEFDSDVGPPTPHRQGQFRAKATAAACGVSSRRQRRRLHLLQKDVCRLQIPVHDPLRVQIAEAGEDCGGEVPHVALGEALAIVLASDVAAQVATVAILCQDVQLALQLVCRGRN